MAVASELLSTDSRCCGRATQGSAAERVTVLRNGQRNTVISLKNERCIVYTF